MTENILHSTERKPVQQLQGGELRKLKVGSEYEHSLSHGRASTNNLHFTLLHFSSDSLSVSPPAALISFHQNAFELSLQKSPSYYVLSLTDPFKNQVVFQQVKNDPVQKYYCNVQNRNRNQHVFQKELFRFLHQNKQRQIDFRKYKLNWIQWLPHNKKVPDSKPFHYGVRLSLCVHVLFGYSSFLPAD